MSTSVYRPALRLSLLPSGKQIVGDLLRPLIDLRCDRFSSRSRSFSWLMRIQSRRAHFYRLDLAPL